jgi:hypothetical protein
LPLSHRWLKQSAIHIREHARPVTEGRDSGQYALHRSDIAGAPTVVRKRSRIDVRATSKIVMNALDIDRLARLKGRGQPDVDLSLQ